MISAATSIASARETFNAEIICELHHCQERSEGDEQDEEVNVLSSWLPLRPEVQSMFTVVLRAVSGIISSSCMMNILNFE